MYAVGSAISGMQGSKVSEMSVVSVSMSSMLSSYLASVSSADMVLVSAEASLSQMELAKSSAAHAYQSNPHSKNSLDPFVFSKGSVLSGYVPPAPTKKPLKSGASATPPVSAAAPPSVPVATGGIAPLPSPSSPPPTPIVTTGPLPTMPGTPFSTMTPGYTQKLPPGVPEYNLRMCQASLVQMRIDNRNITMDQPGPASELRLITMSLHFTDTLPGILVGNIPSTCMVLSTVMLGNPAVGPHPIPMGADKLQWNNIEPDMIDILRLTFGLQTQYSKVEDLLKRILPKDILVPSAASAQAKAKKQRRDFGVMGNLGHLP